MSEPSTSHSHPAGEAPPSSNVAAAADEIPRTDSTGVEVAPPPPVARRKVVRQRVVPRGPRPATAKPARPVPPARPSLAHHAQEDSEESFFRRHTAALVIGAVVLAGGIFAYFHKPAPSSASVKQERFVMIAPLPALPPPPPPPPPPQQKPPEEKMEKETAAVEEPKAAPKPEPVKAPEDPAPLGTGLKGDGAGLAGLGSGSGLGGGTLGGGGTGQRGSRFGWYAGQVQTRIAEALRKHPKTRNASLRIEVRIWPDSTGRITRAQLASSTGDAALDDAIQNGVLNGLQLQESPPTGMRLPIVLRLSARRPN